MRKLFATMVVAAAMGLGGCATTGSLTSTQVTDEINLIKSDVKAACGYVVPLADVAAIVNTFLPGASIVGTITTQICSAVTALGVRRGVSLPQVNGVVLHGYFAQGVRRRHRRH